MPYFERSDLVYYASLQELINPFCVCASKLILEEILNSLVWHHLLIENVSTSLRALNHLDNLCICATWRVATAFFAIVYLN